MAQVARPFSARNRKDVRQIVQDVPATARIGLQHIVTECVIKRYVAGWHTVSMELRRIARLPAVVLHDPHNESSQKRVNDLLREISWDSVYDFCERLHNHLAQEVAYKGFNDEWVLEVPLAAVRGFMTDELQRLFDEENLGYEFKDGIVQRRGKQHTVAQISKADEALNDPRLNSARMHFGKALRYFRDRIKPDPENAIKEAVCAVEAAAKELFPNAKATTLGDVVKWLTGTDTAKLPKTIGQTFSGLYGFRSGGEGVGHGGATGGAATADLAEYAIALAASQIILLSQLADSDTEIPF